MISIIGGPIIGAKKSVLSFMERQERYFLSDAGYQYTYEALSESINPTYSSASKPTSYICVPDYLSLVDAGYNVDLNALFNYSKNIHDA